MRDLVCVESGINRYDEKSVAATAIRAYRSGQIEITSETDMNEKQFYIDGAWVDPINGTGLDVINPSTEEAVATISLGCEADTETAIAAAKKAFETWAWSSKQERLDLMNRILEVYMARSDEMGETISKEMGAPIEMSKTAQSGTGSAHIKAFIRVLDGFDFERDLRPNTPNDRIIYEPIGACGLITPWNWPMNQIAVKVAPALAAGCAMVLKPSEIAPFDA
ncbi:MAG: aldehyde dehydrogenase family protein, partial [Rhizobiaceae bacterium]